MIYGIKKDCVHEHIIYLRISDELVKKRHYNENGQKTKEEEINVREVHQNRRTHRTVDDFFEDMIRIHGYHDVK